MLQIDDGMYTALSAEGKVQKTNIAGGTNCVNVWCESGKKISLPPCFRNMKVAVELSLRAVWIASNMCGLSLQTEHIMLCEKESEVSCPFKSMSLDLPGRETAGDAASQNKYRSI